MRSGQSIVAVLASATLLLGGCTGGDNNGGTSTGSQQPPPAAPNTVDKSFEQVVTDVLPSVVQINTREGLGSGVIYDDKGHVVTNAHVVGKATEMEVIPASGGAALTAKLVASYPASDIAVIHVDGKLPNGPAKFGDSGALKAGQWVLAMGNPLGLSGSVSNGIVSALGRTVTEPPSAASPGATIADMIQTSAAINPGNSGGALVDLNRNVVGIPTLAATNQEMGGAAPGIGFAISSNTVKRIADQIIATGTVTQSGRAALGVQVRVVIDNGRNPVGAGVVSVVPGGPAEKAGIRAGDVITKVNDTEVRTVTALNQVLAALKPGDQAKVTVLRDGAPQTLTVTLGEL